jgi:hypothetical protein
MSGTCSTYLLVVVVVFLCAHDPERATKDLEVSRSPVHHSHSEFCFSRNELVPQDAEPPR